MREVLQLPVESAHLPVGIDLGTTRSVVAQLDATGRPLTVQNSEGDATTPSVVFFERSSVVVGKEALKAAEYEPDRVAQFAKRHLGKEDYRMSVAGHQLPPEIIEALILRKLKADARQQLKEFTTCVITVPAYFNERRRKATQDAGRMAGLKVLDIINEPTAAALAYGVQRGFLNAEGRSEQLETVLVYDLGGGTFDVTLMEIQGADFRAVATAGDVYLGGIDWDHRIANYVAEHFQIQHGIDPRKNGADRFRLLEQAEDAKRTLSQREEVIIRFTAAGKHLKLPLSRDRFESMCGDLTDRTSFTMRRVLKEADRSWKDVSRLLLVGGSSRMPMVQGMLEAESGLKVDRSLSADESVAHGAAIYAGIVLNSARSAHRRFSVTNVNSHDLGLLGLDSTTGVPRRSLMIPRNTPLPAEKAKRFTTSHDNQTSVSVNVIEGGDDSGRYSTRIGKCVVRDLPVGLPRATPVDVLFSYKSDGRLRVLAHLPTVNRKATLTIERVSSLTEDELSKWQKKLEGNRLDLDDELGSANPSVEDASSTQVVEQQPSQDDRTERPKPHDSTTADGNDATVRAEGLPRKKGSWKSRRQRVQPGDEE